MASRKLRCKECDWIGSVDDMLEADNPFDPGYTIIGCPECKTPCNLEYACEVEGCNELSTCGFCGKDGEYHQVCGKHFEKLES